MNKEEIVFLKLKKFLCYDYGDNIIPPGNRYEQELQAFDTEKEAREYLKEMLDKDDYYGGELMDYYQTQRNFLEDEITSAIELNLASKGLKNR
jgi:hypothetical protein